MAIQDYTKAQKMAEKQYRQSVSRGEHPYLPVLEDLLRGGGEESRVPLGQLEIPLKLIAGTVSSERTRAFASNFMPLLEYETEFGSKWSALYDSVQETGVNEPIIVYEYMQRFYVVEGNKRVSVSKYNGAVSIEAVVTRIYPKKNDSVEQQLYAEFCEFYRVSGMYEIEMKKVGGFPALLRIIAGVSDAEAEAGAETGKPPQLRKWDAELQKDVRFLYSVFETYYISKGGLSLPIMPGDAFLHFLEIYGFEAVRHLTSAELHRHIDRVRVEFRVMAAPTPVSHILAPTPVSQKVALTKILPLTSSVLKIAFIYPTDPQVSGWSYNHELGRLYIGDTFGKAIETTPYIASSEQAEETIERAIAEGYKLIFMTSPVYHAVTMRMAVAHPEVIFLNCSMNTAYKQLRTYYLRIYEAKFITGLIAGSMTETGHIGYIADYPVLGTPASVNAFALGVKLVNPRAIVYLGWSTLEEEDPYLLFESKQTDIISSRDISAPQATDTEAGLYGVYGDRQFPLAQPVWNWGSLYENLVRSVLIGAWKNDGNQTGTQALNYYWGMSSGAIDIACSSRLPAGTQKLVKLIREQLTGGWMNPFTGLIFDQSGRCVVERGKIMTPDDIIKADWLADNVVGRIPEVRELRPAFRAFASQHALHIPETAG